MRPIRLCGFVFAGRTCSLVGNAVSLLIMFLALFICNNIQSNLDSSNTDGSFTMANSNSFLSPYEILPIA